jgi:hypothetical protein
MSKREREESVACDNENGRFLTILGFLDEKSNMKTNTLSKEPPRFTKDAMKVFESLVGRIDPTVGSDAGGREKLLHDIQGAVQLYPKIASTFTNNGDSLLRLLIVRPRFSISEDEREMHVDTIKQLIDCNPRMLLRGPLEEIISECGRRPRYAALILWIVEAHPDLFDQATHMNYPVQFYLLRKYQEGVLDPSFLLEFYIRYPQGLSVTDKNNGAYPIHHAFESPESNGEIYNLVAFMVKKYPAALSELGDRLGRTSFRCTPLDLACQRLAKQLLRQRHPELAEDAMKICLLLIKAYPHAILKECDPSRYTTLEKRIPLRYSAHPSILHHDEARTVNIAMAKAIHPQRFPTEYIQSPLIARIQSNATEEMSLSHSSIDLLRIKTRLILGGPAPSTTSNSCTKKGEEDEAAIRHHSYLSWILNRLDKSKKELKRIRAVYSTLTNEE